MSKRGIKERRENDVNGSALLLLQERDQTHLLDHRLDMGVVIWIEEFQPQTKSVVHFH